MQHRAVDKRCSQTPGQHAVDHRARGAGREVEIDLGVQLVVSREQFGNAHRCCTFQRTQRKCALRFLPRHRRPGLLHQVENPSRVFKKTPPGRRQAQTAFLADKQINAQILLKLLDPRGQVRRHAMNLRGGGADAAVLGNGFEDFQLHQIHSHSPIVKETIFIIQFPENKHHPTLGPSDEPAGRCHEPDFQPDPRHLDQSRQRRADRSLRV
ncbi:hypothetical protein D3C81_1345530 [compost metagenome]